MNKFNFDEIHLTNIPFLDLYVFMVSGPLLLEPNVLSLFLLIVISFVQLSLWLALGYMGGLSTRLKLLL